MTTKRPEFESLDQAAGATAANLVQAAAGAAFRLFQDRAFRDLADFKKLNQTEQDRIFNELMVAFLVLIMLALEAPDLRGKREFGDDFDGLGQRISKAHLDYLQASGVGPAHLRDWEKLITLRYEEYARDRHDVRAAAMRIEDSERGLDAEGLAKIQLLVPVQAVAIGCHHHICRGKTQGRDALFKRILKSLAQFYVELRVSLEGGRITSLMRARVALKHLLNRLKKALSFGKPR